MKKSVRILTAVLAWLFWTGAVLAEDSKVQSNIQAKIDEAEIEEVTLPVGTKLEIRLTRTLSTKRSKPGSPFKGKVIEAVFIEGIEAIPAGTYAEGRVTYVKKPGRVKGVGQMRLHLEKLVLFDGEEILIAAPLEGAEGAPGAKIKDEEGTIKGPSSKGGELTTAAVVGATGATVGGLTGGLSGAGIGAGVAAGVVGLNSLFKRGKHLLLPQGTELIFELARPVRVPIIDDSGFEDPFSSQ